MSAASNAQLIREHFKAKDELDREAIRAMLTDDARWWVPISGMKRGLAVRPIIGGNELADMLTTLSLTLYERNRSWNVQHVIADESMGAAQVELTTTLASNGKPYHNIYAYVFRFDNGKIAEIWEHADTAYAFGQLDGTYEAD
jgi:ketosteroid isomerase-like protein